MQDFVMEDAILSTFKDLKSSSLLCISHDWIIIMDASRYKQHFNAV